MKKILVLLLMLSVVGTSYAMRNRLKNGGARRGRQKRLCEFEGNTPLHLAVLRGDLEKVKRLGKYIIQTNERNQTVFHALLYAKGRFGVRKKILAILLDQLRRHYAKSVYGRREEKAKKVREKMTNFLNKEMFFASGRKDTVLSIAISKGFDDIACQLIDAGADVTFTGMYNNNILHRTLLLGDKVNNVLAKKRRMVSRILRDLQKEKKYSREAVQTFLNAYGAVTRDGGKKRTPLRIAITRGYIDIACQLIDAGVSMEMMKGEDTPLNIAITKGHVELVEKMVCAGANVMVAVEQDSNALHRALLVDVAVDQRSEKIKKIVEIILHDLKNRKKYREKDVVKFVNALGKYDKEGAKKRLPLYMAIVGGYVDIVKQLTQVGADVTMLAADEKSTLIQVFFMGFSVEDREEKKRQMLDMILRELENEKKYSPEAVSSCLNALGSVNEEGTRRDTALNLAITQGYFDIAQKLIDMGVDVTIPGTGNVSSLHNALYRQKEYCKRLVENILSGLKKSGKYTEDQVKGFLNMQGTLPGRYIKGLDKDSALGVAITKGYTDVVKMLLQAGADITITGNKKHLPSISKAIVSAQVEVFEYFVMHYLKEGLDPNIPDLIKGRTPLTWITRMIKGAAVKRGEEHRARIEIRDAERMMRLLLCDLSAHLDIRDKKGLNVLHWIILKENVDLLKVIVSCAGSDNKLLEALIQPSKKSYLKKAFYPKGRTPLDMLSMSNKKNALKKVLLGTVHEKTGRTLLQQADRLENQMFARKLRGLKGENTRVPVKEKTQERECFVRRTDVMQEYRPVVIQNYVHNMYVNSQDGRYFQYGYGAPSNYSYNYPQNYPQNDSQSSHGYYNGYYGQ